MRPNWQQVIGHPISKDQILGITRNENHLFQPTLIRIGLQIWTEFGPNSQNDSNKKIVQIHNQNLNDEFSYESVLYKNYQYFDNLDSFKNFLYENYLKFR